MHVHVHLTIILSPLPLRGGHLTIILSPLPLRGGHLTIILSPPPLRGGHRNSSIPSIPVPVNRPELDQLSPLSPTGATSMKAARKPVGSEVHVHVCVCVCVDG